MRHISGAVMTTPSIWLEIAKKDLEAAGSLFEKRLFPHSVFFLQQSIEKMLKSLGIWTKIIDMTEAKDEIGHLVHKIYVKFLKNLSEIEIPDTMISMLEKIGWGKEYVDGLKLRANQGHELLSKYEPRKALKDSLFTGDLLSDLLIDTQRDMQDMRKDRAELQRQFVRLDEKEVEGFRKKLPMFIDVLYPRETAEALRKGFDQTTPDMIRDVLKQSLVNFAIPRRELDFCWISLLKLTLVFSAHEASTRYPEVDFNPLEAYVENRPLIQVLNPFIEIANEICTSLEDVYAKMKPLNLG